MRAAWMVFVVAWLCSGDVVLADESRGARFSVPDGWVASDHDGARVVVPSSLASGELMMGVVLGVQPITGTPAAKIDDIARTLNTDAKVVSTGAMETVPRGAASTIYIKAFEVEAKAGGRHTRVIAIAVRGARCAAVVFLVSSAAILEKYAAGFQAILGSLEVGGPAPQPPVATPPASPTTPTAPAAGGARSAIPTGSTPDKYPGSSGFRPSGRGVPVPAARVVDGRPQGIWWYPQARGPRTVALRVIYLADGTCATTPRPGGPSLFDLEGQRKLGGVGTFTVENGVLSRTIDGFTQSGALRAGSDKEGAYMTIGEMRHRPLAPVDAKLLVGTWKTPGNTYTFRADGTYTSGNLTDASAVGKGGSWAAEGYTLFVRPEGEDGWVSTIGATSSDVIVIDSGVYERAR